MENVTSLVGGHWLVSTDQVLFIAEKKEISIVSKYLVEGMRAPHQAK